MELYIILYFIELAFVVWTVVRMVKDESYIVDKLTIADIIVMLVLPATLVILPVLLLLLYAERLGDITVWRRK